MKVLSFVIPCYNNAHFLDKLIGSMLHEDVLDQLDIIVVDDGSSDNTVEVTKKYCEMYPGSVRLITQENKGHGGALNTGCAAAVGKYLKVIDADDWVETQNLPEFVAFLKDCSSDVVLTHYYTHDISTGEIKKWKTYPREFGRAYTLEEIMSDWKSFDRSLTFHGIAYRTEFYHRCGIQLSEHVFYEDHEFATFPCCLAGTVTPLDLFIYDYRIGDLQQSVSDENQLKRIGHTQTVLRRMITESEKLALAADHAGREYVCMKAQGLLLSYFTTAMLVEKDKKKGREMAAAMMAEFADRLPRVCELANKQYKLYGLMNRAHISKRTFQALLRSRLYNKLRHNHDFD